MSRTVLLLRHATAARPSGVPDRLRPLTREGRGEAAAVGRGLAVRPASEAGWAVPALVLVSPSRRTQETLARAAEAGLRHGPVSIEPAIYEAEPETLLSLLSGLPDTAQSALLVGHNPGIAMLAGRLLRAETSVEVRPADLLVLQNPGDSWAALGQAACTLVWRQPPETPGS